MTLKPINKRLNNMGVFLPREMSRWLFITLLFTACGVRSFKWVSPAEMERKAPFHARVDKIYISSFKDLELVVTINLTTAAGESLSMADTHASPAFESFAKTLVKGGEYEFPTAWKEFKAKNDREVPALNLKK